MKRVDALLVIFSLDMIQEHKVMRKRSNSAKSVGCSKFWCIKIENTACMV